MASEEVNKEFRIELEINAKPVPEQSGSAGTQNQPPPSHRTEIIRQGHLGAVLGQFIDSRNPAVVTLSIALYRETIIKLWEVEQQRDDYREKWNEESKQNAVLRERQNRDKQQKWVDGILNVLGGTGIAIGLPEVIQKEGIFNIHGFLLAIGIFLVSLVFIRRKE